MHIRSTLFALVIASLSLAPMARGMDFGAFDIPEQTYPERTPPTIVDRQHTDPAGYYPFGCHSCTHPNRTLGFNPLHQACKDGHHECLEVLLAKEAEWFFGEQTWVNQPDTNGMTPLHIACGNLKQECAKILIWHSLPNVDAQNKFGQTPLMLALQGQKTSEEERVELALIMTYLHANGHTNTELQDQWGWTAYNYAAYYQGLGSLALSTLVSMGAQERSIPMPAMIKKIAIAASILATIYKFGSWRSMSCGSFIGLEAGGGDTGIGVAYCPHQIVGIAGVNGYGAGIGIPTSLDNVVVVAVNPALNPDPYIASLCSIQ